MSINVKDTDKWVSVDVDYSKIAAKLASSKQIELVGDVEGRIEDSSNVETGEVYTGFDGSRDVQIIVTYNPDSIAPAATNDSEGNLITDTYLKRSGGDIFGDVNFKLTKEAETAELTITKEGNITGHNVSLDGTLTSVNITNSNNLTSKNANIDNIVSNVEINSNEAFSSSIGNTTPFNVIKAKKIELLTNVDTSGFVLDATTGIMNIAPSVTNTGSIGTFSNIWADGYFNNLHATNIVGNFTESISFTDISNNVVSYNGSDSLDLTEGIYYSLNAFQLSSNRTFGLINGASGSTITNLNNGVIIDVTDLDSRKLRNTVNTAETTFDIIGDISANAATSTKLETARTFEITGVTSIPQSFDGTGDITIPITVVPIDLLSGILPVTKGGTGVDSIEGVVCGEGTTNLRGCTGGYGYIPKWDNTTFGIEESVIFETESGNIGINTETPTHKLDVNGDGNFNGDLSLSITDTSTARYLSIYNNNSDKFDWRIGLNNDNFEIQTNYPNNTFSNTVLSIQNNLTSTFSGNVIPNVDNTLTLGNDTNKWANIHSYQFNGFVLDNASERKAGILATNVPIIGTNLSTTDNSLVTVDANGYLKTVDILSTDVMRLSTEQIVTGIKRFNNNIEFLDDIYVNVTGEDRFVYIRDNALTPSEVWRYGYIAEHDDIEDMFVLQHYNADTTQYENVVQFSSVSYALEHKGSIYPSDNNTYTIGTTDHQYSNVYSSNFTGHLVGNADTATQLLNTRNFSISGGATAAAVGFNGTNDVVLNITNLDATLLTGLVPKSSIPQSVLPTLITVADETARYALTTSQVKLGDIVKQLDTEQMFYVVDINNLSNSNGYEEFTTAAVDWSTIVNKPETFTPSAHTHTISDITGLNTGTAILPDTNNQNNKILAVYNNAAQWATLTLTGSVTGTATIESSGTISVNTVTNHTHSYLPLSGGTLTGNITTRSITPANDNAYVLGSDTLKWSNIYSTTFTGNLTGNVTGNVSGSSGSCTGNAATATKLAAPVTINGVPFDGSSNISITAEGNFLPLSGGVMTGNITLPAVGGNLLSGLSSAPIQQDMSSDTSSYFPIIRQKQSTVTYNIGGTNNQFGIYMYNNDRLENGTDASLIMDNEGNISATGTFTASRVYNAVYNDYAECFNNTNLIYKAVLHRIVEIDDNECVRLASKNSYRVIGVVSDNYGHLLGGLEEDIESGKKIPVGLAGTLYVYTLDEINTKNIGKFVCADNNGYATLADKDSEGTIVGKIIGFNKEYHQYKVLLILK